MKVHIGTIALFAGKFTPRGWLPCNGASLPADDYSVLTALGFDSNFSNNTINLPQLEDLGKVKYFVCVEHGSFPPSFEDENYIGFVTSLEAERLTAVPDGWVLCDGLILNPNGANLDDEYKAYESIAQIVGIKYGKNKDWDSYPHQSNSIGLPNLNNPDGDTYIICIKGNVPTA